MVRAVTLGGLAMAFALALPASALAVVDEQHWVHAIDASASFSSVAGCTETDIDVSGSHNVFQVPPGGRTENGLAAVFIGRRDVCTPTRGYAWSAEGQTTDLAFTVSPRLDRAVLQAVVPMIARDGTGFTLTTSVSWTATSPLDTSESGHEHLTFYDSSTGKLFSMVNDRSNEGRRDGLASGSISDGTTDYIAGLTGSGPISYVKASIVEIVHP